MREQLSEIAKTYLSSDILVEGRNIELKLKSREAFVHKSVIVIYAVIFSFSLCKAIVAGIDFA